MELFDALNQRRCIRSYTDETVTEEEINKLISAAIRAPSSGNRQSWRFVIIRKPETIDVMYRAASYSTQHQKFVKQAPVNIVVCADLSLWKSVPYRERGETLFAIQDTAAAIQNLLLAACEMNLGACWVGLFDEDRVRQALNIPKHIRPMAIIPVGHHKSKTKPTPRKAMKDVAYYESF
jgi:nitroreductase